MTVWKCVGELPKYGIAIFNYLPTEDTAPRLALSIHVGELLEITFECEDWYYGRRIAGRRPEEKGIVPKSYVKPRDCSVDRTGSVEVVSVVQPQIVQEITQTLRSWGQHWKKLYVSGSEKFKFIEVSMRTLLDLRSAILSGTLPIDQLKKEQRTAIYTIDRGNRELGMDLTVRCTTTGNQIDPRLLSTSQLYTLHQDTSERIKQNTGVSQPSGHSGSSSSYSFFASVRNFVCKMSEDAELLMSLYDGVDHKHFTESYVVHWSKAGLASDIDQLHNLRVLFTDLGSSDVKREKVYLVCYVVRIGGMEPQVIDNRRSSVAAALANGRSLSQGSGLQIQTHSETRGMRRPLGVAAMDVTHFLSGQIDVDDDKHHCVTFFPCEKDNNLDNLLRRIIANKDLKGDAKTGQGLWLSVKLLHGDLKQIREEVPHLVVGNVSVARKMGFPEVILPGDARNDLYLCLSQGCFTKATGKSSDRNIQVTVKVCNQIGNAIPGVISLGGGVPPLNEYNSVVYYHDDKPRWNETFKICVPIEEFKQAHVVFLFRHRSSNDAKDKAEKPFALAYTNLMQPNGTTLNDTLHTLCVYKVEGKKWASSGVEAATCYLSLPSQRNPTQPEKDGKTQKGFLTLSPKDSFVIGTNVCSTKLTQNVELLGVLNWYDQIADDSLRNSLHSLQSVAGGEIVKFLQDILDALFSILTRNDFERNVDCTEDVYSSYDFLVFECLLSLISLVSDRKFTHFQPVLDLYIKESFCATLAYKKLCMLLSRLISDAKNGDNEVLLKSMKCLEYLVRFIVRSRELHAELTQKSDQHDFQQIFQDLLGCLVDMMKCDSNGTLTSQGACIKYLPSTVPHIIQVFPDTKLATMIGDIFHELPLERLTKQRLIAILDLVQGPLFLSSHCRCILLPHITSSLKSLIHNNDETSRCGVEIRSKIRSVDKIARVLGASKHKLQEHRGYSEQFVTGVLWPHDAKLELSVKILGEILSLLFRKDVGPTDEEFNHISYTLLITIIQGCIQMDRENPLVCQLVSVLLELLRQMSEERYKYYVSSFASTNELMHFIMQTQLLLRDLLDRPVYHHHWADMINLQNYCILHTFRLFASTLVDQFQSKLELQLWSNWFHLVVAFVTQPSLQLHKMLPEQRRRITSQFGDMRQDGAKLICHMWYSLGQHKIQFIPSLVGPFLGVSLIPESQLRRATIPLFFDMMQCEYNSCKYSIEGYPDTHRDPLLVKGNFNDFENEMIHELDILVEGGTGDAEWSSLFVELVGELCENQEETGLRESGGHFVKVVGQLLDTLMQYRALHDHSSMDYRMQATTTLLDFYSDIKRPEMYIRYVNKLCELHLECENWAEAGLTQRLHAKLLQWSSTPLVSLLRSHKYPHCHTHRDLKETLYYEIISYLDKGKMWELAVGICKELVTQYEEEVFDYCHLSDLYNMMAGFYASIIKQPRPQPEYFRVGYYGKGFPHLLQNKVFVYKGKDYERLQDFCSRILNGLPNAELMTTLTPPGEDIKNSDQQYVQINAVEPIMSEHNRMSGKPISNRILQFYQHNNVNKFRYSRPFYRQDEALTNSGEEGATSNEFANLWLERTELEIREKLPAILRWCPVIKSNTHEMSPLQVAVETMKDTNKVLRMLVIEHRADNTLPLDPLTRKLNGVVDAAVMGGIVNYEKAFFTDEYQRAHPEHRGLILTLKDLIAQQIPLLEFGIEVHRQRLPASLKPLHQRITECFENMKAHVHEKYGKKSCDLEKEISLVTMRRQISALNNRAMSFSENRNSFDNRWSETSILTNHSVESGISMGRTQANSFKAFSTFSKQDKRGSLGSGISSGYPTLRKRDKERRRARKSEVVSNTSTSSSHNVPTPQSQWYTSTPSTPSSNGTLPNLHVGNNNYNKKAQTSTPDISTMPSTPIVELRQELTPSRPLRSEVEKERRLSQRPHSLQSCSGNNSNRNSVGTTDSNISNEDDTPPPPLPQKMVKGEPPIINTISSESYYQAVNFMVTTPTKISRSAVTSPLLTRQDYDLVFTPRDSSLYKSLQPSNASNHRKNFPAINKERAPTPPPKRRLNSVQH